MKKAVRIKIFSWQWGLLARPLLEDPVNVIDHPVIAALKARVRQNFIMMGVVWDEKTDEIRDVDTGEIVGWLGHYALINGQLDVHVKLAKAIEFVTVDIKI